MRYLLILLLVALASLFLPPFFSNGELAFNAHAVEPPTAKEREHASTRHEEKKTRETTHCASGADPVTGKCFKPREGQFYRDPQTGKLRKKRVTKYNWPWK